MNSKTIAIIGVGAIGSKTAIEINKLKFNLIIIDRDVVEEKNLSYQELYSKEDIGKPKALVAKEKFGVEAYAEDLNFENISILDKADLILDCTDNMETRFLINDYCLKNKKPWIYAAGLRDEWTSINFLSGKPCFRCIFNNARVTETCETAGISQKTIDSVSKVQVENAKKILSGEEIETNMNRNREIIKIKKKVGCEACNGKYEYLTGKKKTTPMKLCGTNTYQIKGPKQKEFRIINKNISVFEDGRALIKASSEKEAKTIYAKYVGC